MIELLIAVGAVGGLMLAAVPTLLGRLQGKTPVDMIEERLAELPARAASDKREIRIATGIEIDFPDGWWITTDRPIVFTPDGYCTASSFVLRGPGAALTYDLRPPGCRPVRRN